MLARGGLLRSVVRANAAPTLRRGAAATSTSRWEVWPEERKWAGATEKRPPAVEFTLMVRGLQVFKQATGHFLVPFHFPIPARGENNDAERWRIIARVVGDTANLEWPEELRGMNLGRVVHKFMTNTCHHERYPLVVAALREIGFPVDADWKKFIWHKFVIVPLRAYNSINGDTMVPTDFVVPHGDPQWPRHTWGFRLGARVHRLRRQSSNLEPNEIEDLRQIEFSFDVVETTWTDKVLPALETFVKLHKHCNVKRTFVVPSEDPWPKKAWDLPLGSIVSTIRNKDGYSKQVARDAKRLQELDFVWDYREASWKEIVLPSLETFYAKYGHSRVGRDFVVPSEAPWPRKAWGYALGVSVNHIRCSGAYAKEIEASGERFKAIEFVYELRQHRWRESVLPSLEVFSALYNHCRVPREFVVPAEEPWPEESWHLKLGNIASDIRYAGAYAKFVMEDADILRMIGFLDTMSSIPVQTKDYWETR